MEPTMPLAEPPAIAPVPVMDVVPPPTAEPENLATPPAEDKSKSDPVKETDNLKPTTKTTPKTNNPSVVIAIWATVIIVLGLAALTTFAYLKTK